MADEEAPLPPVEIPWKLAASTQPLAAGEPAQTALSLFFFEPDDATLTGAFPDEQVVFIKVTASVSPASFPKELSKVAASFLGEGIPCMHLLLDLNVRNGDGELGTIRPYFHAAAPLARRMIQTGVIGSDAYEGESDTVAIGKSGSQMTESLRSHSNTLSASASAGLSLGPVSLGGSVRNTTTDVASQRAVSQVVDTTTRQASDERRELLSHTTRVENIISLLSAKYIGTPYLSFSLSPQPQQQLSIDPSDPYLWFQQLLARRSSGIESTQEFTAVVIVPKNTAFCIGARLRRVCLLDSPPGPLNLEERFNGTLIQFARMVNYLNRTFPPGTPLEELNIDIIRAERRHLQTPGGRAVGFAARRAAARRDGGVAECAGRRRRTRQRQLQAHARGLARHAARRVRARVGALAARALRAVRREPVPRHLFCIRRRRRGTLGDEQQCVGEPAVPRAAASGPVRHRRRPDALGADRRNAHPCARDGDVYWHFQGCRNPLPGDHRDPTLPSRIDPAFPNYVDAPIPRGLRVGMPFVFRCGRLLVMVLDSRGDRDVFRADKPTLGARQWQFVDEVFSRLPDDVDALAVVTATPLASQDPDGQTQRLMGQRTDDVEAFRKGDEEARFHPESSDSKVELVKAIISAKIVSRTGFQPNFGAFQISNLDECATSGRTALRAPSRRTWLRGPLRRAG